MELGHFIYLQYRIFCTNLCCAIAVCFRMLMRLAALLRNASKTRMPLRHSLTAHVSREYKMQVARNVRASAFHCAFCSDQTRPDDIDIDFYVLTSSPLPQHKNTEDSTNEYLNENWRPVSEALRPIITRTIEDILLDTLNKIFHYIPADYLISDIAKPAELYA